MDTPTSPYWGDLSPEDVTDPATEGVFFNQFNDDADPDIDRWVFTWSAVPEFSNTGPNTFQVQLFEDGCIVFGYAHMTPLPDEGHYHCKLVGLTPGGNVADPGEHDYSSALPFDTGVEATVYEHFTDPVGSCSCVEFPPEGGNIFDLEESNLVFCPNGAGGWSVGTSLSPGALSVSPRAGGNTGRVTVRIGGADFSPVAQVMLTRDGEPSIVAVNVNSAPGGRSLTATFDLRGRPPGPWTLAVINPGADPLTLRDGFEIVDGGVSNPVVDLLGPTIVRAGREVTFFVIVQNRGLVDVELALLRAAVPFSEISPSAAPNQGASTGAVAERFAFISSLAPGASMSFPLPVPFPPSDCFDIGGILETLPPPESPDFCPQLAATIERVREAIQQFNDELEDARNELQMIEEQLNMGGLPEELERQLRERKQFLIRRIQGIVETGRQLDDLLAKLLALQEQHCPGQNANGLAARKGPPGFARTAAQASAGEPAIERTVCPVTSWDPNDKVGPAGSGEASYVSGTVTLPYTVFFENVATATAPAQRVAITDQLESNLDLSNLFLGTIRFGTTTVLVPAGVQSFATTVDLRPENDLLVNIEAALDPNTRIVTWSFTSIDPVTGQPPTDPLAGFLSPNVNPPEGEGSVSFTFVPKAGLPTGTEIRNKATIVFDTNPPIDTAETLNTLDNTEPSSEIAALASTELPQFPLEWSGTDVGSGIKDYTIFVSEDGGPFTVFLRNTTDTSATFTGQAGKAYAFLSVARDQAGNVEAMPTHPDTSTTARLNHFKCYKTNVPRGAAGLSPRDVTLVDQFESKLTTVIASKLACAPVDKNGEGIPDPTAHLVCYKIKDTKTRPRQPKFEKQDVLVANQFGDQPLTVTTPTVLCVPSERDHQPSALNLDHFKCYGAKTPKTAPRFRPQDVSLVDQFETKATTLVKPVSLCTPVDKNGEGLMDPTSHLTCYMIKDAKRKPRQSKFEKRDVIVDNQFGEQMLEVTKPALLCVPSLKSP